MSPTSVAETKTARRSSPSPAAASATTLRGCQTKTARQRREPASPNQSMSASTFIGAARVRVGQQGNHLSTVRVANDPAEVLAAVSAAGPAPGGGGGGHVWVEMAGRYASKRTAAVFIWPARRS